MPGMPQCVERGLGTSHEPFEFRNDAARPTRRVGYEFSTPEHRARERGALAKPHAHRRGDGWIEQFKQNREIKYAHELTLNHWMLTYC